MMKEVILQEYQEIDLTDLGLTEADYEYLHHILESTVYQSGPPFNLVSSRKGLLLKRLSGSV